MQALIGNNHREARLSAKVVRIMAPRSTISAICAGRARQSWSSRFRVDLLACLRPEGAGRSKLPGSRRVNSVGRPSRACGPRLRSPATRDEHTRLDALRWGGPPDIPPCDHSLTRGYVAPSASGCAVVDTPWAMHLAPAHDPRVLAAADNLERGATIEPGTIALGK